MKQWHKINSELLTNLPTAYISVCSTYIITEGILGDEDGWVLLPNTNDMSLISENYHKLKVDNKHFSRDIEKLKELYNVVL